jgi:hypothetical protein
MDEFNGLAENEFDNYNYRLSLKLRVSIYAIELCITYYSSGIDIDFMRKSFQMAVDARQSYVEFRGQPPEFEEFNTYIHSLWLISLAYLLRIPGSQIDQLITLIGNHGRDALYDRLVSLCVPLSSKAQTLLYPRPYQPLFQATNAPPEVQVTLIQKFLQRYYQEMHLAYWHDQHRHPKSGFFGYWCFELAALVKALHIPDQTFANNLYYPGDMITYEPPPF